MKFVLIVAFFFSSVALAQTSIPAGTVLPVQLNSSLNSRKSKPGDRVTARIMQDVPISSGRKIRSGAKVIGRVVSVKAATNAQPGEITFRFEKVKSGHHSIAVVTNVRALASMMAVEDAQIPPAGTDRGTPWAWTTRNLIGDEVAYGEGGPVVQGGEIVGQSLYGGMLAPAEGNSSAGCRGEVAGNHQPQALWVFASDACGIYGMDDVQVANPGRTGPIGEITLTSQAGNVEISGGSGMLLRVNEGNPQ